jgi:predicted SnoaL-like aldol condensation-catalyzing enzyme
MCQQGRSSQWCLILTYRWKEILVRYRQDNTKVYDGIEPRERIFASKANAFPGSTFVVFCEATRGDLHTIFGHLRHLGCEISCAMIVRVVWNSPETDDTNEYTKAACCMEVRYEVV